MLLSFPLRGKSVNKYIQNDALTDKILKGKESQKRFAYIN